MTLNHLNWGLFAWNGGAQKSSTHPPYRKLRRKFIACLSTVCCNTIPKSVNEDVFIFKNVCGTLKRLCDSRSTTFSLNWVKGGFDRLWPVPVRRRGERCYTVEAVGGVKKTFCGMQKMQKKKQHLLSFQWGKLCEADLEGLQIKNKEPKMHTIWNFSDQWQTRSCLTLDERLTGLVILSFAGDFERVDVEAQVPRHRLQQQHGEGAVRVVVVYHRVDLARVQPVSRHVALGVKQRPQHLPCRGRQRGRMLGEVDPSTRKMSFGVTMLVPE